ncbi:hypothetical protein BC940DRAFT_311166 [Gongronella butleri]|nr:hypothetical protein BC940DRAFT_311166 [Gongronella butleri]
MDLAQFRKALEEMPIPTLLSEIPAIQNAMVHLLRSNQEIRDFDPDGADPELTQAVQENMEVLQRQDKRIDMAIDVIRERINDAAAKEVADTVATFRERYLAPPTHEQSSQNDQNDNDEEQGVFL